jgi:hypothetical protein
MPDVLDKLLTEAEDTAKTPTVPGVAPYLGVRDRVLQDRIPGRGTRAL